MSNLIWIETTLQVPVETYLVVAYYETFMFAHTDRSTHPDFGFYGMRHAFPTEALW